MSARGPSRPDFRSTGTTGGAGPVVVCRAWDLARGLLAGLPRRWRHTVAVAHCAALLTRTLGSAEERDLLSAAAWLHDIGYPEPVAETGFHPFDGADYLRRHGWPPRLVALVAHHSGAIFVARARGLAEALHAYPREQTALSDALTYADQTTGPTGERLTVRDRMADMLRRHGSGSPNARVHHERGPYLLAVAARVEQRLRAAGFAHLGEPACDIPVTPGPGVPDHARMSRHEPTNEPTATRWSGSTAHPDMWVDPHDDPRESADQPVGERATLLDYLRRYRLTLEMKCTGLDAEQLARRSVPPSTMSLLGLLRHLADVERHWFRQELAGQHAPRRYRVADDRDGDFNGAVADPDVVDDAWRAWRAEVAFAEEVVAGIADLGTRGATGVPLRDVLVHMIEEYARHCGHADLLRERIDGRVGQ